MPLPINSTRCCRWAITPSLRYLWATRSRSTLRLLNDPTIALRPALGQPLPSGPPTAAVGRHGGFHARAGCGDPHLSGRRRSRLRAAIELASPANKDRPRNRLTFAGKCVGYLERGVGTGGSRYRHHPPREPARGNRGGPRCHHGNRLGFAIVAGGSRIPNRGGGWESASLRFGRSRCAVRELAANITALACARPLLAVAPGGQLFGGVSLLSHRLPDLAEMRNEKGW